MSAKWMAAGGASARLGAAKVKDSKTSNSAGARPIGQRNRAAMALEADDVNVCVFILVSLSYAE